jgi:hypothetical protein
MALKQYPKALRLLEAAVTMPTQVPDYIIACAWQRYQIITALLTGEIEAHLFLPCTLSKRSINLIAASSWRADKVAADNSDYLPQVKLHPFLSMHLQHASRARFLARTLQTLSVLW